MAECTDSPRAGVTGCHQTYGGELQHCVAKASWSTHPDGRAHVTGAISVIDEMWRKGGGREPADPATIGFHQGANGRWRWPDRRGVVSESDETDG